MEVKQRNDRPQRRNELLEGIPENSNRKSYKNACYILLENAETIGKHAV